MKRVLSKKSCCQTQARKLSSHNLIKLLLPKFPTEKKISLRKFPSLSFSTKSISRKETKDHQNLILEHCTVVKSLQSFIPESVHINNFGKTFVFKRLCCYSTAFSMAVPFGPQIVALVDKTKSVPFHSYPNSNASYSLALSEHSFERTGLTNLWHYSQDRNEQAHISIAYWLLSTALKERTISIERQSKTFPPN